MLGLTLADDEADTIREGADVDPKLDLSLELSRLTATRAALLAAPSFESKSYESCKTSKT